MSFLSSAVLLGAGVSLAVLVALLLLSSDTEPGDRPEHDR